MEVKVITTNEAEVVFSIHEITDLAQLAIKYSNNEELKTGLNSLHGAMRENSSNTLPVVRAAKDQPGDPRSDERSFVGQQNEFNEMLPVATAGRPRAEEAVGDVITGEIIVPEQEPERTFMDKLYLKNAKNKEAAQWLLDGFRRIRLRNSADPAERQKKQLPN